MNGKKSSTRLFKYLEEEKVERMKALCQASKHTIDCVDRKMYLFDELPTHRKFNVLGPEGVLKMKRIDFGEYSLIPIVPLLRMYLALKNFVHLL
nr:hypothetical protein CFP56_43066 [Quercus suber]